LYSLWEDYFGEGAQFATAPWFRTVVLGKVVLGTLFLAAALTALGNHFYPRRILRLLGIVLNGGAFVCGIYAWWFLRGHRPDPAEAMIAGLLICVPSAVQAILLTTLR
jgi:protein-S-isoprenylcysteine O-methyltransferase Ste14